MIIDLCGNALKREGFESIAEEMLTKRDIREVIMLVSPEDHQELSKTCLGIFPGRIKTYYSDSATFTIISRDFISSGTAVVINHDADDKEVMLYKIITYGYNQSSLQWLEKVLNKDIAFVYNFTITVDNMEEGEPMEKKWAIYEYADYEVELNFIDNNFRVYKNGKKIAYSTKGYDTKTKALQRAQQIINVFEDKIEFLNN